MDSKITSKEPSAQQATPEQKQQELAEYEKHLFGPYPATNRHERRKAAKLMRGK